MPHVVRGGKRATKAPLSAAGRGIVLTIGTLQQQRQVSTIPIADAIDIRSKSAWNSLQALLKRALVSPGDDRTIRLTRAGWRVWREGS